MLKCVSFFRLLKRSLSLYIILCCQRNNFNSESYGMDYLKINTFELGLVSIYINVQEHMSLLRDQGKNFKSSSNQRSEAHDGRLLRRPKWAPGCM